MYPYSESSPAGEPTYRLIREGVKKRSIPGKGYKRSFKCIEIRKRSRSPHGEFNWVMDISSEFLTIFNEGYLNNGEYEQQLKDEAFTWKVANNNSLLAMRHDPQIISHTIQKFRCRFCPSIKYCPGFRFLVPSDSCPTEFSIVAIFVSVSRVSEGGSAKTLKRPNNVLR
jgi:hypothetical protein